MPASLLPLLPLLGRVAPDILILGLGGRAAAVASRVEAAVRDVFGTVDPDRVLSAAEAEPAKAEALGSRLAADARALEAEDDAADARAAAPDAAGGRGPLAWGSPIVSTVVVLAFAAVAVVVFSRYGVDSAVGQLIAGALIAKFGTVVDFWLGSSKGSSDRADQITALLGDAIGAPRPARGRP